MIQSLFQRMKEYSPSLDLAILNLYHHFHNGWSPKQMEPLAYALYKFKLYREGKYQGIDDYALSEAITSHLKEGSLEEKLNEFEETKKLISGIDDRAAMELVIRVGSSYTERAQKFKDWKARPETNGLADYVIARAITTQRESNFSNIFARVKYVKQKAKKINDETAYKLIEWMFDSPKMQLDFRIDKYNDYLTRLKGIDGESVPIAISMRADINNIIVNFSVARAYETIEEGYNNISDGAAMKLSALRCRNDLKKLYSDLELFYAAKAFIYSPEVKEFIYEPKIFE